jgi:UDP-2,4-diacetamido-2,4,6-trideoxy-beta-L-altropyranose hydrolase
LADLLVIRADASVSMGTGHVMRCLALAQAWQDAGGEVVLALGQSTPALVDRLRAEQVEVVCFEASPGGAEDAGQLVTLAKNRRANWVVVDGYQFNPAYPRCLKQAELKLLVVDDNNEGGRYSADLVLNQNLHATEALYAHREPYTRLLLGTRYSMLRREFKTWRGWKREIAPLARKILVSMGGSGVGNLSGRVIEAIGSLKLEGIAARVIVGAGNPQMAKLERLVGQFQNTVGLEKNPCNIPELMAWADVCVSAAGSTCWELCLLGLPALVFDVAENQRGIARSLDAEGVAIHGGGVETAAKEIASQLESLLLAPDVRARMSQRGKHLVDGRGADRVVSAMRCAGLGLRRAKENDCRMLWEWVNDPEVRAASFSSESIPWEKHADWFIRKLRDPNCLIFIAEDERGSPAGQVRFERMQDGDFETDISIARDRRGWRLGACLMAKAAEQVFLETAARGLHAFIKMENQGSIRLFEEAGFGQIETVETRGCEALHYVRGRPQAPMADD